MALKVYIGARYAPKFSGAWNKGNEYSALEVVYANNQSYVSRKTVPANTEITNTEFWIKSSDWNAQVAQYNANVEQYNTNVERYNTNVEQYQQAVSSFYADTMHSYNTKEDMVNDETLKLGETLLTCGNATVGDGGGSFWQVVGETSANAVALKNGLFAIRVQLEPYNAVVYHDTTPKFTKTGTGTVTYLLDISDAKTNSIHVYNKVISGDIATGFVNAVTVKVNTWSSVIVNGIIKLYIQAAPLSTVTIVPYTVTTATGVVLCKASVYNDAVLGINLYIVNGKVEYADTFTKNVEEPAVLPNEFYEKTATSISTGNKITFTVPDFNYTTSCPVRYIKIRIDTPLPKVTDTITINLLSNYEPNTVLGHSVTVFEVYQKLSAPDDNTCTSVKLLINNRTISAGHFGTTAIKAVNAVGTSQYVFFSTIVYGANAHFITQSANLF